MVNRGSHILCWLRFCHFLFPGVVKRSVATALDAKISPIGSRSIRPEGFIPRDTTHLRPDECFDSLSFVRPPARNNMFGANRRL